MRYSVSLTRSLRVLWVTMACAIATGELLPTGSMPVRTALEMFPSDKAVHAVAYAVLASIPSLEGSPLRTVLMAAASFLLGVVLELLQRITPDRQFEVADILANGLGVVVGAAGGFALQRMFRFLRAGNS